MQVIIVPVEKVLEAVNADYLFTSYASESKTDLTPEMCVNKAIYYNLEKAGILDTIAVYSDDILVGFAMFTTSISPHYNNLGTQIMSIFILKEHRKYGAGKKLFQKIEDVARAKGSTIIIVSSPVGGRLGKFVPLIGYKESNILYGKPLCQ